MKSLDLALRWKKVRREELSVYHQYQQLSNQTETIKISFYLAGSVSKILEKQHQPKEDY